MNILGIGQVVLDKSCILPKFIQEHSKVQPQQTEYSVGGPVASALILLSRLGADCTIISSIGQDSYGQKITEKLKQENLTVHPHPVETTKVNTYLVNAQNGSRTGIKSEINYPDITEIPVSLVQQADLIILDRHEPLAFQQVIKHKSPHTPIILDPATEVSPKTINMLKQTQYPIIPFETVINIQRGQHYQANLEHLYDLCHHPLTITAGDKGAFTFNGTDITRYPAVNITCVDSLGAGDIFRGAFAYAILKNQSLDQAVQYANLVAGLQCTRVGNGTAIPTPQEIADLQKHHFTKQFTQQQLDQLFE